MSGEGKSRPGGKFRLEQLEPRVLLSADPLAVVLTSQLLLDATVTTDNGGTDAVSQQIDAGHSTQENLSVVWPASWQASSTNSATTEPEATPVIDLEAQIASTGNPDSGAPQAAQLEQAAPWADRTPPIWAG